MSTGGALLVWSILLLILPLNWLLAAFVSAFVHEGCHLLALWLCGGKLRSFRVGLFGAIIESEPISARKQFLAVLAGPVGSLLLAGCIRLWPELAVCGFAQGLYNMLPFYPLDGGRLLELVCGFIFRERRIKAEHIFCAVVKLCAVILVIIASACFRFPGLLLMLLSALREKYLANGGKKGYNNATIEMR